MILALLTALASAQVTDEKLQELYDDFKDFGIDAGLVRWHPSRYDPLLRQRQILVTTKINNLTSAEVVTKLLQLDARDSRSPIDLVIRSTGGWLDDAFAIVDAMDLIAAPVNVWALGGCKSACAVILVGATGKRYVGPRSYVALHANMDEDTGEFANKRIQRERFEALWRENAKLPADWYPLTGSRWYFLDPKTALDLGVVDAIGEKLGR